MPHHHAFWIIGETTLAIRCAQALRDRGHDVRGLVTANELAAAWARERGISLVTFRDALPALAARPYDYLLSIVNSRILGADILATPTLGAINFHDGPLPRYAGMHSTSWAILNQEPEHGITWHGVAELVDAGPIFRQRMVAIEPADTALSLNARCYEAALGAFEELADDFGHGPLSGREQDLSARTYFPRLARPEAAGLIDWDRPASAASALVRALDFGAAYPNPLVRAKVRCGRNIYLCGSLRVTDVASTGEPGTVVSLDASGLTVAAADRHVVIEALAGLDGSPASITTIIEREGLAPGRRLGPVGAELRRRITERVASVVAHESYWLRALRRVRAPEIPYRTTGALAEGRYHRIPVSLPPGLAPLGGEGVTQYAMSPVLIAGLAGLLSRLTQDDSAHLAIEHPGLRPPDGRDGDGEALALLFARHVPLEVETARALPFAANAAEAARRLAEALRRDTHASDLPARHPELRGRSLLLPILVRIAPDAAPAQDAGAELILDVPRHLGAPLLWADAGVLSARDAGRIAEQLEVLLAGAVATPDLPVSRLPVVPSRERATLLDWNATEAEYPRDATIHALFEERARAAPGLPAVHHAGTTLSFAELNARADVWAELLRARGITRDAIVGLRVERSPELVVGMLAILKAGGAYLPLDPSLPERRTAFMLEDAGVEIVLTSRALLASGPTGACTYLALDEPPVAPAPANAARGPAHGSLHADAGSLAYVIYTSGSTGAPKGVLVHHRGVVNYISWAMRYYEASCGSGSPVHSPIAFDLTVTSLLVPLLAGRPVHLLGEDLGIDGLAEALRGGRDFTLVKLTPSHLDLLRHQLAPEEAAGRTRAFVIGGESLLGPALGFWQYHAPATRLINEYGPTETVVGCCVYEVPPGAPLAGPVPIGRPIANTRLHVLDPEGQLLPIGIPGELFIGGDGVARGYLNRPALTAERFLPDPFAEGGRLYRTGDRARYLADGNLEFLGRIDGQVKLRGYRIELGEIEATLTGHPAVSEAAATLWSDPVAGPRLAAYITVRGSATPEPEALREWCARSLPEYMIPGTFDRLPRLPLTGNGKLDRAALPAPAAGAHVAAVPPRTALERRLAAIWSEVLGVPVGLTDNFFELGGHSLLAVRMISRVREETGFAPPLSVLLTRPTVMHVAAAIEAGGGAEPDPVMLRTAEGERSPPFFYWHGDFSGGGFYAETISRQLGGERAMYALRPHRPGDPASIEAMATLDVELVRSVQPRGPYLLGGMCNGGAMAFEVARLLRAQGEEVRLLALVNTAHRNAHLEPVRRLARAAARLGGLDEQRRRGLYLRLRESVLRTIERHPPGPAGLSPTQRLAFWARIGTLTAARVGRRIAADRLRRALGRPAQVEPEPPRDTGDDLGFSVDEADGVRLARYRYIDGAMREYLAASYDGHATVIWWEESGAYDADPELHDTDVTRGWGSLCDSVETIVLPGEHRAVPGRDVEALARALASLIHASSPETASSAPSPAEVNR